MLEVYLFFIIIFFTFFSCSQDGRGSKSRVNGNPLLTSNTEKKLKLSSSFLNNKISLETKRKFIQIKANKQQNEEKCTNKINEIQEEINNNYLNMNKKDNDTKKSASSKRMKDENFISLDKTQSYEEFILNNNGNIAKKTRFPSVPKTKRQRRKDKKSDKVSCKVVSGKIEKSNIDEIVSTYRIENLFKKFNDSIKEPIKEVKEENKVLAKTNYQFREKPPPEPIDNDSSLILLLPKVNIERYVEKNEQTKIIQPDMIKRTKKEQKMVEGTWYNKILDENTLDDVPSDWDENRRPKKKKKVRSNFEKEYDNIII